ncbi:phosphopantothenoylcysteine decarboxylase [Candidatus Margulisiibacteriota bacterium]
MKILITAGGTREPIDPVRYIGNRSSGRMGRALVAAAEKIKDIQIVFIDASKGSALDLHRQVMAEYATVDIVIMAAAVADYTPVNTADSKIKKGTDNLNIQLTPTIDILAELGRLKQDQFLVGFCLETENLIAEAKRKLKEKNLDFIVANSVEAIGSGHSQAVIITKNSQTELPDLPKEKVAEAIINEILRLIN